MSIYVSDKGVYSTEPLAAGDTDSPITWVPLVGDERVVQELNAWKNAHDFEQAQVVARIERVESLERQRAEMQEYLSEKIGEGMELLNAKQFAERFGFDIQVTKDFTMTIQVQGTLTFNLGDEPDLNNLNVDVDVSSYYDEEVEVGDVSVTDLELEE